MSDRENSQGQGGGDTPLSSGRRRFLALSGISGVGAALAGCTPDISGTVEAVDETDDVGGDVGGDDSDSIDVLAEAVAELELAVAELDDEKASTIENDQTYRIPTDYPTLQAAVDDLSTEWIPPGVQVTLHIESGHQPASGVAVEQGDFSRFVITADDDPVVLPGSFDGSFVSGDHAMLPVLDCSIDMAGNGEHGYAVGTCSVGRVERNRAIRNAGSNAVYVLNGRVDVRDCTLTGAQLCGIRATHTSSVAARQADVSGAGDYGVRASYGSTVYLTRGKANDCGAHGIYAIRSRVIGEATEFNNNGVNGVRANRGAHVSLTALDGGNSPTVIENSGGHGIWATNASTVDAQDVVIHNCDHGVRGQEASTINIRGADIRNCDRAVGAVTGSQVVAVGARCSDSSGNSDLVVWGASTIDATDCQTTSGTPWVGDINLSAFNSLEGRGTIFDRNA